MELVFLVVVAVAVAVGLLRSRAEFVVVVENGRARLQRGQAPRGFIEDCERLCAERAIRSGRVTGTRGSGAVQLGFSAGIAEADRQRFRNIWNLHG
jgi:hypothetical protein